MMARSAGPGAPARTFDRMFRMTFSILVILSTIV